MEMCSSMTFFLIYKIHNTYDRMYQSLIYLQGFQDTAKSLPGGQHANWQLQNSGEFTSRLILRSLEK